MDNPLSNIDPSGLDCQDGWYSADEEGDCFPGVPGYYNGGGGGGIGSNGMTGIEATDQWIPDVEVVGGHWVMDYNLNTGLTNMVWGGYYYVDFGYWAPIDGSNPGIGTLTSGGTGGGGGGGGGGAPNNGSQKPGFWSCTFTGNVGASWGETALDAVGIIPFGGNGVKGVQLASGIVAGSISAYKHSMTGAGLSAGGLVLTAAEDSGAKLALNGVEMIPLAGNVVSAVATGVDIFGNDGLIAAYKSCMAGTHP